MDRIRNPADNAIALILGMYFQFFLYRSEKYLQLHKFWEIANVLLFKCFH